MQRYRKRRRLFRLFVLGGILLGVFLLLRARLMPIMQDWAVTQVDNVVSSLINDAINQQIAKGDIDYNRLVILEKNASGEITALQTNMSEVNRLKTEVLSIVNGRIDELTVEELGIPLGNLFLPEFFAGSGPKLPMQVLTVSTSDAQFDNEFASAGINQTVHRIRMRVIVTVSVLTPGGTVTVTVPSQVVVAETVIVGSVPDQFFEYSGSADQAAEQYQITANQEA